jgi:hypothetical protein
MVSGDMYPGDLLKAVKGIPADFWTKRTRHYWLNGKR